MKSTRSRTCHRAILVAFLLSAVVDCGGKTNIPDTGGETGGTASTFHTYVNGGATATDGTSTTTSTKGGAPATSTSWRDTYGGAAPGSSTYVRGGSSAKGGSSASSSSTRGGSSGSSGSAPNGGSHAGSTTRPQAGSAGVAIPTSHRPTAASCVGVNSPPEPTNIRDPQDSQCSSHADCTAGVNGKCVNGIGMAYSFYSCVYDKCSTDADCDPGKICYCTPTSAAKCLSVGNCQVDADCGGGPYSYCSPSMSWDCGGYRPIDGYHCHTASDTCLDDADCTGTDYCNFDVYEARWKCTARDTTCVIG